MGERGDWGRRASPRKGAVPSLDLPPTHSYSRPADMGAHGSGVQAAMDRLPQNLSDILGGEGSQAVLRGSCSPGRLVKHAASQASSPQTTDSSSQGPGNSGHSKDRLTVVRMENGTIFINNNTRINSALMTHNSKHTLEMLMQWVCDPLIPRSSNSTEGPLKHRALLPLLA